MSFMDKGLVIGLGNINKKQILKAKKFNYKTCIACGPAINLTKELKIKNRIMFLNEARLAGDEYWDKVSKKRNEKQTYNYDANNLINYQIPNEIWVFHHKLVICTFDIEQRIRSFGFKGRIKIYSMRSLFCDMIKHLGINSLFLDNQLIAIIDILLSILLDKMVMKFGLKIPSGGIIAILACLNQTKKIDILGISLNRKFGYINNRKYSYPKKGQTAHIIYDKCILEMLDNKIIKL